MRTQMTLIYKGFEVSELNPRYTLFYFESEDGEKYSWVTAGSPQAIMDLPLEGEKVVISARVDKNTLAYVKVVR